MIEIELKFQIPEAKRAALLKAIDPKKSKTLPLQARYFDTTDRLLATHGIALRQRLEGEHWVQTLKAAGKSHLHRFEHNHDFGVLDHTPALDLSIYPQNSEAWDILDHALNTQKKHLHLQFETDIQRTLRVIQFEDSEIEVCLDVGEIRTETAQYAVHEVEFELKSGTVENLLKFCFEWVKKYQLWLDVRSKAEFGNLLLMQKTVSPARLGKNLTLNKKLSADANLRQLIAQQLQHLLPNIAAISAQVAEKTHIEQAHEALNQLYLSLSLFGQWSSINTEKWAHQLAAFKQQFEHLQHLQHMQQTLGALLQNPKTANSLDQDLLYAKEKLQNLVKSSQNVQHYLELLIFSLAEDPQSNTQEIKSSAQHSLQQQYKAVQDSLNLVHEQPDDAIRQLTQQLHALKFSFPLLTSIYDVKNLQKYSKALQDAEQAAEQYQVLASSMLYLQDTELEASDWFALGWLTAKQENYAEALIQSTEQFLLSRKFIKS